MLKPNFRQKIKGIVIDKDTEYPLVGVNVILLNNDSTFNGTTTDLDGRFELKGVKLGRQMIQLSSVGYKAITIPNILVNSAKENVLYIKMEEDLIQLRSVVITANKDCRKPINEIVKISAISMTMGEVTRFSGSNGDVARMAQNYAGVSGADDGRNDLIVRGNSPSGVLRRMEGVDIPSPNHWSKTGSSGGPISMINTNNLRNSDLLSGVFPAEYGNATAAIFGFQNFQGFVTVGIFIPE